MITGGTMKSTLARLLLISVLGCLIPVRSVLAQSFSFGLRPEDQTIGYFQYSLGPGQSIEDALLAVNPTDEDILIRVSVVAGHTARMGGVDFPGEADGAANWINLPEEGVIAIPARQQVRLPFTLTVPEGTAPGEYVAGFLAAPVPMTEEPGIEDGLNIHIVSQMGLTVVITVPGEQICEVVLGNIHSETNNGSWIVILSMQNTGNIHFKGVGEFALVSHENGSTAAIRDMKIGYFIAGDEMHYPLEFTQPPPAGNYRARLTLLGEDCTYQALFNREFSIKSDEYLHAEAEAVRWEQAQPVSPSSGAISDLSSPFDQLGLLLIGTALIVLILTLIFYAISQMTVNQSADPSDKPNPSDSFNTALRGMVISPEVEKRG
jgi:hypothetical protein